MILLISIRTGPDGVFINVDLGSAVVRTKKEDTFIYAYTHIYLYKYMCMYIYIYIYIYIN